MATSYIEFLDYWVTFERLGGISANVKSLSAHWLYGTKVEFLVNQSKLGIVYNPPTH